VLTSWKQRWWMVALVQAALTALFLTVFFTLVVPRLKPSTAPVGGWLIVLIVVPSLAGATAAALRTRRGTGR
jgi:hypothetical protein